MAGSDAVPPAHPTDRIVGHAPPIEALRAQIRHLVAFDTVGSAVVPTLLLQGETGTGKGLVAWVIHASGPRAQGPFVEVNCAAIPETLLEVELFGFEAGTFTDAKRAKPGLVESAAHGTLFLDEIDALPVLLQAKLLSVIEEKRVRRLGAVASRQVDVKVIAATATELSQRVTEGRFRADLYHRLGVVLLEIPPVRERGADILALAQHFLRQYAAAHGLLPKQVSRDAEAWLRGYGWPGNVRELSHLMERVTLLSPESVVQAAVLERLCLPRPRRAVPAEAPPVGGEAEALDAPARMRQALSQTGGNVVQAARRLQMSRGALRYWMRRYGIGRPSAEALTPPHRRPEPGASGPSAAARDRAASAALPALGPAWEQKPVVVLAIDVIGPEALEPHTARADPWTLTTRWHQTIAEQLQGFGGGLVPSAPAPLLAVFGLPQTLEQMPQRAVQAALAIRQQLAEPWALESRQPSPAVRMAVHLGQVLAAGQARDPTAQLLPLGETLSLPVRLLGQAAPGDILLSPPVGRLVEGWFTLHGRAGPAGAGRADGLGAYAVVGVGPRRSALEAYGKRPLSRFVGREQELAALGDLLAQAAQGRGQVVGLVGEPGVGKSRLCYEFVQAQRPQDWLILESSPVAYGQATPYLPVLDLLKAYFQLDARDAPQTSCDKVLGALRTLAEDCGPTLPAVLALLDLPLDDPSWLALDPVQRRQRTLEACVRLLLRTSQRQPLLVVVENLHWIDTATQAVLDHLVDSLPHTAIVLLVNYRPDYHHRWGNKTYYTQLRLDPLPPAHAVALLHEILGDHPTLAPMLPRLITRTEGNPFFLEESVRTLVETGILVGERGAYRLAQALPTTPTPATVQTVLAARIDRLPPDEKRLLHIAAVIGTEVPLPLLQAMAELPEAAVHAGLRQLQAAEFLYETHLVPAPAYSFKHALTHEVAYHSLFRSTRQQHHQRIAQVLETHFPALYETQPELLAHHYTEAGLAAPAIPYWQRAGQRALQRSAPVEARRHLTQGLALLATLPETPARAQQELDLQLALGVALFATRDFSGAREIEQTYARARVLCTQVGDTPQLFSALRGLCRFYYNRAELQTARELGEELWQRAQRAAVPTHLLAAHSALGMTLYQLGDFRTALPHCTQGMALIDPRQQRVQRTSHAVADGVVCLFVAANVLWCLGFPAQAVQRSEESLALAQALEHPLSLAVAQLYAIYLHHRRRDVPAVQAHADALLTLVTAQGFPFLVGQGLIWRGYALAMQGQDEAGLAQMRQGLAMANEQERVVHLRLLAEVVGSIGQVAEGLCLLTEALILVEAGERRDLLAETYRVQGALLLQQTTPDAVQAEACFQQALAIARHQQARSLELRAAMSLSRLWQQQGKWDEAHALLAPIYSWFTEGFDTADLQDAKAFLEELGG